MHAHVHHMPGFKAVSVVVCYNIHAHAYQMPDFKAVGGGVQHTRHMPDFKGVKVSVVKWYNMLVTCQTSRH